jgi:hypothetical protein
MRESFEFRIPEERATRWLAPDDGELVTSSVRKLRLYAGDPRLSIVANADRELKRQGRAFFTSFSIRREYTEAELNAASRLLWRATAIFEPEGEENGTVYDEQTACRQCGAGATQLDPLILDVTRVPKRKSFARTIASEMIVSQPVVDLFESHRVTGIEFRPVMESRNMVGSAAWKRLAIVSANAEIAPPTRVGNNPFDEDVRGQYRCPLNDLVGLNLLSELSVYSSTVDDLDFVATRQFVGVRRGVLRPERLVLVSQKVRRLITEANLSGCEMEAANLVV